MNNTDLWRFAALFAAVERSLRSYMAQQRCPSNHQVRTELAEAMLRLAEAAHECEQPIPTADPVGIDLRDFENVVPIRGLRH